MREVWLGRVNAFVKADQTTHFIRVSVTTWDLHLDDHDNNVHNENDDGDEATHGILGKSVIYSPRAVASLKVSIINWTQNLDPFSYSHRS